MQWGLAKLCGGAYSCRMSETSDLIKRLRGLKLSQSEIARRTGIPQPRISRWENASEPIAADDVLKLVRLEREVASQSHSQAA